METQGVGAPGAVPHPKDSAGQAEKAGAPVRDAQQLRLAILAAGVALWSWNVDTNRFTMDERAFDLWGVPLSDYVSFDDLSAHIHPADRDRVKAAFSATRAIIGPYKIDFRIWSARRSGGFRLGARAMMLASSGASCTEFHRRDGGKQAEEGNELLAGEMSHRVKNLLAIASGLTAIASRSAKTTADMAKYPATDGARSRP